MTLRPHPEFQRIKQAMAERLSHAIPRATTAYRFAAPRYANADDLLTGKGSKLLGARWTPRGGFETIYAAIDAETAVAEVFAHHRHYGFDIATALPRVFVAIRVRLDYVLDLSGDRVEEWLGIPMERIRTEGWREMQAAGDESTTQAIGRAAWELRLQAILVPSIPWAGGVNFVIFPGWIGPEDLPEIVNAADLPVAPRP